MFWWLQKLLQPALWIAKAIQQAVATAAKNNQAGNQGQNAGGDGTPSATQMEDPGYDPVVAEAERKAAAKRAEEARKKAELKRREQAFERDQRRQYGDEEFLSPTRPADERLRKAPELVTGWQRSRNMSLLYEGGLYFGFLGAGGLPSGYFAGARNAQEGATLSGIPVGVQLGLITLPFVAQTESDNDPRPCPSGWTKNGQGFCVNDRTVGERFEVWLLPEQAHAYQEDVSSNRQQNLNNMFLAPALLLNNPNVTNMSPEALAALVFSQVYVEEDWAKGDLNWIHPYYNRGDDPNLPPGNTRIWEFNRNNINDKRYISEYYYTNFMLRGILDLVVHLDEGNSLTSGLGFGLGNQTYSMAYASASWYRAYAAHNPTAIPPSELPTRYFTLDNEVYSIDEYRASMEYRRSYLVEELADGGWTPTDGNQSRFYGAETSSFWNVMRFLYAGAMQREGISNDYGEGEVDYSASNVGGTSTQDISAFGMMSYVYSGQAGIGINFAEALISNGITNSEVLKAIEAVERLGRGHPEFGQIVGEGGLNVASSFENAYEAARAVSTSDEEAEEKLTSGELEAGEDYDYLPYNGDEARVLVEQLAIAANNDPQALYALVNTNGQEYKYAPTLLDAFVFYHGQEALDALFEEYEIAQ